MAADPTPDVSLVLPCFDEAEALPQTAPELLAAFAEAGVRLELVLVDNGSSDGTGAVIDGLVEAGEPVVKVAHAENQGYGGGVLSGLAACTAPVIGHTCADGQVSAADTLMCYRLMDGRHERVLAKVRRRFRQDSPRRKAVSIAYNGLMAGLYGRLGSIDINGTPKFYARQSYERMALTSRDWFLDPEIVVKAAWLGLRVIEVDVEGHARRGGASHVGLRTCLEFGRNIARYRFGAALRGWEGDR